MKPFLFFISCMFAIPAFAQDNNDAPPEQPAPSKHFIGSELIISHGFAALNEEGNHNNNSYYYNGYYNNTYSNNTNTGTIAATYRYHFSKLLSLGVTVAYNHQDGRWSDNNVFYYTYNSSFAPYYGPSGGTFRRNSFTVAPEITFNYCDLGHGLARLYSVVGMGYTYHKEVLKYDGSSENFTNNSLTPVVFNMYVSPFGVRFGRALSGFFEVGIGYKGLLSDGLTYRF